MSAYEFARPHSPEEQNRHMCPALKMETVCLFEMFMSAYEFARPHSPDEHHHMCPALKMETVCLFEMFMSAYEFARPHSPEEQNHHMCPVLTVFHLQFKT
jgi:hypothetical protein